MNEFTFELLGLAFYLVWNFGGAGVIYLIVKFFTPIKYSTVLLIWMWINIILSILFEIVYRILT